MITQFFTTHAIKLLAGLSVVLAGLLIFQTIDKARITNQRDKAENAKVAQVNEYRRVYNDTFQKHFAAAQAENLRLEKIKDEANAKTQPRRTAALAAAADYRGSNRCFVQQGTANIGSAGGASLPGAPAPAGRPQGASEGLAMVAISEAAHDACTLNTADLWIVYEWGQSLPKPAP